MNTSGSLYKKSLINDKISLKTILIKKEENGKKDSLKVKCRKKKEGVEKKTKNKL